MVPELMNLTGLAKEFTRSDMYFHLAPSSSLQLTCLPVKESAYCWPQAVTVSLIA